MRCRLQVSPCQRLHSSLPPLPLYDQPPCSPYTSPETSSAPSLPRSPSVNGEHKLPIPQKASVHSKTLVTTDTASCVLLCVWVSECFSFGLDHNSSLSPESPGFSQPLRLTPDGSGPGKLRPVCQQHSAKDLLSLKSVFMLLWTFYSGSVCKISSIIWV